MSSLTEILLSDNLCKREGKSYSNNFSEIEVESFILSKKKLPSKFKGFIFPEKGKINKENIHLISLKESKTEKKVKDLLEAEVLNFRKQDDDQYFIKTSNYLGVIYDNENKIKVEITSRFGEKFLHHMINYINDIFIPNISFEAKKDNKKDFNQFQFILAHLFIQSLEKSASIFGLPKAYKSQELHSYKVRGKLDIKKLIQYNIPLRTKLHSNYREQIEVQEIVDVLHKALSILDNKFKDIINARVLGLKNTLKEKRSSKFVDSLTIQKAKNHKALINPTYQPFKQVLKYAEMIIKQYDFTEDSKGNLETTAYLFDATELFEVYLEKLLRKNGNLDEWEVRSQERNSTYGDTFFGREIRPDMVLIKEDRVAVFDVKYKRMNYFKDDVDRNDFFQIHTYMAYYNGLKDKELLAGGLLYPIEAKERKDTISNSILNEETKFIIDGIYLKNEDGGELNLESITKAEEDFVKRIKNILEPEAISA